jgi:hypothetical protein
VDLRKYMAAVRGYHEIHGEWPPPLGSGGGEGGEAAANDEAAQGHHPKKRLSNRHLKRRPWK